MDRIRVDWNQFNQLRELDATGALEREMLEIFLKDTKGDLDKLYDNPKHYAHRIKGRSAQLGFVELSEVAGQLQQNPDSHDLQTDFINCTREALDLVSRMIQ